MEVAHRTRPDTLRHLGHPKATHRLAAGAPSAVGAAAASVFRHTSPVQVDALPCSDQEEDGAMAARAGDPAVVQVSGEGR